jgi:hypothetical protein
MREGFEDEEEVDFVELIDEFEKSNNNENRFECFIIINNNIIFII